MRILWLYRYIPEYDFDNWLHMKFAEYILNDKTIDIVCYGPRLHEAYRNLVKLEYNPDITMEQLFEKFNPNAIILVTKSRMFMHYNPHTDVAENCWLPKDFNAFNKIPKIVLEEDYHYEKHDQWYQEVGINLILQRHYNSSLRQQNVPMIWFPFSVDTNIFKPDEKKARINKVGFAGTCNMAYPERQVITEFLRKQHLLDGFYHKEKIGNLYIEFLKEYEIILSGISAYNITPAKMFEIMASGGILLTNDDGHLQKLFPPDSYLTYSSDSNYRLNNLVFLIKSVLEDKVKKDELRQKGLSVIKSRHSHDIRIQELKKLLEGICQRHGVL